MQIFTTKVPWGQGKFARPARGVRPLSNPGEVLPTMNIGSKTVSYLPFDNVFILSWSTDFFHVDTLLE